MRLKAFRMKGGCSGIISPHLLHKGNFYVSSKVILNFISRARSKFLRLDRSHNGTTGVKTLSIVLVECSSRYQFLRAYYQRLRREITLHHG